MVKYRFIKYELRANFVYIYIYFCASLLPALLTFFFFVLGKTAARERSNSANVGNARLKVFLSGAKRVISSRHAMYK